MQDEKSGNGLILIGVVALIFFPVFFLIAVVVLVGIGLIGVKPKIAGIGLMLFSFVLFGLMMQVADGSDSDSFVPFLVMFLIFFLGGFALLLSELQKTVPTTESGKIRLNVIPAPASPPVSTLSEEKKNAIIEAALAEAQRQMEYVICPDPIFRERYFETVFTRLCERQGVNAAEIVWKRTKV